MRAMGQMFILFIITFSITVEAAYESEIAEIKAVGRGDTKEEAIKNAKIEAIASFAEYFSVRTSMKNNKIEREVVSILEGVVEDYDELSSYKNKYGHTVIAINARLSKDSVDIISAFDIDPDLGSMNVNGSFYATENAKWNFNSSGETKFIDHLLTKIQMIGKNSGFVEPRLSKQQVPKSTGKKVLQNNFHVDFYATKNMEAVMDAIRTTLRSLTVKRGEYATIPTRQIYEVELCTDAIMFGNRFENQKKGWRNSIPDCKYETFYLRNQQSIELLQWVEEYVSSEILDWVVVRKYSDGSCKKIVHTAFNDRKHSGITRVDNRKLKTCINSPDLIANIDWDNKELWPSFSKSNGSNQKSFSNNLVFNTCNVAYNNKQERIFFPVSRHCRAQTPTCAIPYRNSFGKRDNISFGLNLPLGGELIARKEISDTIRESDLNRLKKYQASKDKVCN